MMRTPDIARETSPVSSLSGSLELRIKYAFLQTNFDDWMTRGSWARLGIQQTPWVDFEEGIYRYRFQGTVFVERDPNYYSITPLLVRARAGFGMQFAPISRVVCVFPLLHESLAMAAVRC